jgi:type I restriction enzyme R subunit
MVKGKEEKAKLSDIIGILNERFATDFSDADRLFFEQIQSELIADEKLIHQAQNNSIENFKYGFEERFIEKLIDRMDQNQEIFAKILNEKDFGDTVKKYMLNKVFSSIREAS